MHRKILIISLFAIVVTNAIAQKYPKGYFRNPLNIPMALVANFGEIRANHWHMGLDIRTQQKVNLPVYAAAEGYISRIGIEPAGFGQAVYITHPNGYITVYGHLNAFSPTLAQYIKGEQYRQQSWKINLSFLPTQFPVSNGDFIGLSGSTGGSQGPHVHFEIRDAKTEKVLNPLLFQFPVKDAVPPSINRLAMYDRTKSTYNQQPQFLNLQKIGAATVKTGCSRISFAIGANDKFSGSSNPNGIYEARMLVDGKPASSFTLDNIGYDETRYINAQIDYPYAARGGASLQHITPLPGATGVAYDLYGSDGIVELKDGLLHEIMVEVLDANKNTSRIKFSVQYDALLARAEKRVNEERFLPNAVNIFERENFQLITTENTIYDTVNVSFNVVNTLAPNSVSSQYIFLNAAIPLHDLITIRLKPSGSMSDAMKERIIIKNTSGKKTFVQKATWQKGWLMAKFRQLGSYTAFIDVVPPSINNIPSNLSKASRIIITPTDNFEVIKSFRAELDGQWLRFTNDKGKSWIYSFDEHFPRGEHELKVRVEDEAGNVTERLWKVKR